MLYIALFMVLLFAIYVLRTYWWQYTAKWYGIETDASVSWIEKQVGTSQGGEYVMRHYYVRFLKADGRENEARLLNPKKQLLPGTRIRIRYLPERDNYAVLTAVLPEENADHGTYTDRL